MSTAKKLHWPMASTFALGDGVQLYIEFDWRWEDSLPGVEHGGYVSRRELAIDIYTVRISERDFDAFERDATTEEVRKYRDLIDNAILEYVSA